MGKLQLEIVPVLQDNYVYLLHDDDSGLTAAIDPGEAEPVLARLAEKGWRLTHIFNTHHHHDHTGGNLPLKRKTTCVIVGFAGDAERIPGIDIRMGDDDTFLFGTTTVESYHVPGHTQGAVMYYIPSERTAFTGDTLFTMGCGRLLEGEAYQLLSSLRRIVTILPDDTKLYSGHEYAHGNARFALTVDPENKLLQGRFQQVADMVDEGKPVQGGTMKEERATNPFLRPQDPNIRKQLNMLIASDDEVFAELRKRKDAF